MCGICGVVGPGPLDADPADLDRMRDSLRHRGPEGSSGMAIASTGAGRELAGWLGHRRLKILDLSDAAEQPMCSDDGHVVLTYNGEVYNFRGLRSELEDRGHRFRSTGDTEVVLRAYEQWGPAYLERIDGMFALAVWDARRATLLLARDRTGKKPLFYTEQGGRLTFGSEIKALLTAPWVEARPALDRLPEFLTFGYVPNPATLLEGIAQVPPGSSVEYGPGGLGLPRRYWDPLEAVAGRAAPADINGEIRRLVTAAVERRMISDVPLGALLSGGIDSSIVVGLMAKMSAEPVHTFSIGFTDDESFDERSWARQVADGFGTRHTEFAVQADAVSLMDRLLWHHDQPYMDSSAVPTYLVSQLAREHVTVALNGDGGDEVFGGYDRFRAVRLSELVPGPVGRAGRLAAGLLPHDDGYHSLRRRADRFLELLDAPVRDRYQSWIAVFGEEHVRSLAGDSAGVTRSMDACYERVAHLPVLDQVLYANFLTYLPDDLAVKMDRMSMAHSLETRSPFLDTAVVELLATLPASRKVGLRRVKPLLRKAFRPLLPKDIWNRKKHGFGVPMNHWFRGELGTLYADEVLAGDSRTAGVLDRAGLARMAVEHRERSRDHGSRMWTVLTLERWLRAIERPWPDNPPGETLVAEVSR